MEKTKLGSIAGINVINEEYISNVITGVSTTLASFLVFENDAIVTNSVEHKKAIRTKLNKINKIT